MDKLTHYRSLVKKLMTEYAEPMRRQSDDDVETATVFDDSSDQFMLVSIGWKTAIASEPRRSTSGYTAKKSGSKKTGLTKVLRPHC